ncbi:MAG TPA: ABC transporter substrate-binding protein, partial [Candidatus Limnocylindria bacterium]|nr:ABC transporter substrate-binding protein [Candidatus Limnocylindria bacterium]
VLAACGQTTSQTFSSVGESIAPPTSASAQPSAESSASVYPLTLTDDARRTVTLAARPERIVSLAPSNTEIVCAVGACDALVGVTDFDDYPAQVKDVPKVVIQAVPDVEKIVAARPDLVLAAGNQQTPQAVIDRLIELKLPVLVLYPAFLDGVYADLTLVGRAVGREAAADSLVGQMRDRVEAVRTRVADASRPRVFYEISVYQGVIYTAGKDSFLASLIETAGGQPITGDATGVIQLEDLVAADPQLILLGDAAYEPRVTPQQVAARAGWGGLTAVRQSAVKPMPDDEIVTRPGPRIVDGLETLARAIHPELFG